MMSVINCDQVAYFLLTLLPQNAYFHLVDLVTLLAIQSCHGDTTGQIDNCLLQKSQEC